MTQELIKKIYDKLAAELPEWDIHIIDSAIVLRFNSENVKYNVDMYIRVDNGIRIEVFMPDKNGSFMIVRNNKAIPVSKTEIRINHDGNVDRLIDIVLTIVLALAYNT